MTTATSASTVPLRKREEVAGTLAFHFAKPTEFQFRAGQALDMTLLALGLEVRIEGPSGSCTLHRKAEKSAVFLAGASGSPRS